MTHEQMPRPESHGRPDMDEVLRMLQAEQFDAEALQAHLDEESMRNERKVLDAMHLAGLPVKDLEDTQTLLGPDQPLQATLEVLHVLLQNAAVSNDLEALRQFDSLMATGLLAQQIAGNKALYDSLPEAEAADARAEEQLYFLNDDTLSPGDREKVLRTINLLYDEGTGLDLSDPHTLIAAAQEKAHADRSYAITEAAKAVRGTLETATADYMAAHGLGEHDDKEEFVAGVVVAISREYASEVSAAAMNEAVAESFTMGTTLLLDFYRDKAHGMGWTDEQFDELLMRLRHELRNDA